MANHEESAGYGAALDRAREQKSRHPAIDRLLTARALARALQREPLAWGLEGPLTLASCLASDLDDCWPPLPTLRAINENLAALSEAGALQKPGQLVKKLLNPPQFLNTMSELALARTLIDHEWSLLLDAPLSERHHADADILAVHGDEKRFIDVTNLAHRPLGEGAQSAMIAGVDERALVAQKIITKYREKFEVPLAHGWSERAWVAIDVAKNERENIDAVLQTTLRSREWYRELAGCLRDECPDLAGFGVYRHQSPTHTRVAVQAWIDLAQVAARAPGTSPHLRSP